MLAAARCHRYLSVVLWAGSVGLLGGTPSPPARAASLQLPVPPHGLAAPVLDGHGDDYAWTRALTLASLVQVRPQPGAPPTQLTRCRILPIEKTLYVLIEAFDSEPHLVRAVISRRDDIRESDWVAIAFDTQHDHRTAYTFAVTAAGVQRDARVTNDVSVDDAWDTVWESAVVRTSNGWSAEMAIPLGTLRATPGVDKDGGAWGIQLERWIERTQERSALAAYGTAEARFVSRFAVLKGTDALPAPRQIEVVPYVRADVGRGGSANSPSFSGPEVSAGLDGKLGLLPALTLDVTVNPDFGQVEADPSVVNLNAYEVFQAERRPFFLEGAELFRRKLSEVNEGSYLVHSRRIGRAPPLVEGLAAADVVSRPTSTTILGAVKLTGRPATGWSVGVLEAVTGQEYAGARDDEGVERRRLVEPLTSYTAARVEHSSEDGRTRTGAAVTAVRRHMTAPVRLLRQTALTASVDVARRMAAESLQLELSAFGSYVAGAPEALLATQRSPVHNFQRPDAQHLRLDPLATSLSGWGAKASLVRITGRLRGLLLAEALSPGLEVNDLGYLPTTDRVLGAASISYTHGARSAALNDWGVSVTGWQAWSFGGERILLGANAQARVELLDASAVSVAAAVNGRALGTGDLRGGPALLTPLSLNASIAYSSDPSGSSAYDLRLDTGLMEEGLGQSAQAEFGLRVRAGGRLRGSLRPRLATATRGTQYVGQAENQYVVGQLVQQTVAATAQVDLAVSRALTVQLYIQPFVTIGRFSAWNEVADPRARSRAERFRSIPGLAAVGLSDPSFSLGNLNTNLVVRWQPKASVTLFAVWSHRGRTSDADAEGLAAAGARLFRTDSAVNEDIALLKLSWWIGG